MMNLRSRTLVCAGLLTALSATTPTAWANLLVDPGFESNPLTTIANPLANFPGFQGVWGIENATITGVDNGVTPAQGAKMLRMDDDGAVTTQGVQVTDVTSYAGPVDAGLASLTLAALFNVDANTPAAVAGVYIQFFSAANYGSQIGTGLGGSLALDASVNTWETASVTTPIPVGTRWLMSQVYYSDASLIGNDGAVHAGYVDVGDLRVIPEPSAVGLLILGAMAMLRRRNG